MLNDDIGTTRGTAKGSRRRPLPEVQEQVARTLDQTELPEGS